VHVFLTGSQAYGCPTAKSDVDLVVLVTPATLTALQRLADPEPEPAAPRGTDSDPGTPGHDRALTASLRFGRLNLICVTDPIAYGVWAKGTAQLEARLEPVGRDEATALFRSLRALHGLADAK
jgi:hypothetical protein